MFRLGLHSSAGVSIVASQQKAAGLDSLLGPCCVQFALCVLHVSVDSLWVIRLPSTAQKHTLG